MEISQRLQAKIKGIVDDMGYPKDFVYCRSKFTDLSGVKKGITGPWLTCSEAHPDQITLTSEYSYGKDL